MTPGALAAHRVLDKSLLATPPRSGHVLHIASQRFAHSLGPLAPLIAGSVYLPLMPLQQMGVPVFGSGESGGWAAPSVLGWATVIVVWASHGGPSPGSPLGCGAASALPGHARSKCGQLRTLISSRWASALGASGHQPPLRTSTPGITSFGHWRPASTYRTGMRCHRSS